MTRFIPGCNRMKQTLAIRTKELELARQANEATLKQLSARP